MDLDLTGMSPQRRLFRERRVHCSTRVRKPTATWRVPGRRSWELLRFPIVFHDCCGRRRRRRRQLKRVQRRDRSHREEADIRLLRKVRNRPSPRRSRVGVGASRRAATRAKGIGRAARRSYNWPESGGSRADFDPDRSLL